MINKAINKLIIDFASEDIDKYDVVELIIAAIIAK